MMSLRCWSWVEEEEEFHEQMDLQSNYNHITKMPFISFSFCFSPKGWDTIYSFLR